MILYWTMFLLPVMASMSPYRLDRLSPVDQFRWSPHLELVGCFSRPRTRRRG